MPFVFNFSLYHQGTLIYLLSDRSLSEIDDLITACTVHYFSNSNFTFFFLRFRRFVHNLEIQTNIRKIVKETLNALIWGEELQQCTFCFLKEN